MKKLFNQGFEFKKYSYDKQLLTVAIGLSNEDYENVCIPHDALIEDAHNLYNDHVIWYRKKLGINKDAAKRYILYFDGVYMDATIYINETEVYRWVNGYTSFWLDITDYFNNEEDYLLVSINYQNPNARWYAGPGITRDVWLYELSQTHFIPDGIYIHTDYVSDNEYKLYVTWEIADDENSALKKDLKAKANEAESYEAENQTTNDTSVRIDIPELGFSYETKMQEIEYTLDYITAWDIDNPKLYEIVFTLYKSNIPVDEYRTKIGFRKVILTTDNGLFLNDRHIKLNGVCLHSDYGALGSAFDVEMARRQLTCMQNMGANAVRLAHNTPAPSFLSLCDEMGILVMDECFDCWKGSKTTYDYGRFFEEWNERDIASYIRRDKNHPSVILWSAGNEIYDTHQGPEGKDTLIHIADEIKKHDPKGNAYITLCSNYMAWENTQKAVEAIKIVGYNYGERLYDEHHKEHSDWIIYGSETASCVQSRGVYHFPLEKPTLSDDDGQCSSLGNSTTSWGAKNLDFCLTTEREKKYSLGQFLWSGIDYLGEPTPYHSKNSFFGMADTACFPKDAYYNIKAGWVKPEKEPVLYLFPYWDFNEGQRINVRVATNLYKVELYLNDKYLGEQTIDIYSGKTYCADFVVPYKEGTLKALGYDNNGEFICEAIEKSFKDTDILCLSDNNIDVCEGDTNLRFVEVTAKDQYGNEVKNANDRVILSVVGPGNIVGIDNGDSTDYDSFKGNSKRLFNGKLLVMIKPTGDKGQIKITARKDTADIPVRKLELFSSEGKKLTFDNPVSVIKATAYPANACLNEIEWQITNESGISIQNIAIIDRTNNGREITIKAVADAQFKVRALHREKDGRVTVISQIEMTAEGFGELFVNPYQFVSASLYSKTFGDIGNGNEKGIATSRTEDTWVCYENIDFGLKGSKEVTIPIFEMDNQPTKITFWCGIPHEENSYILGEEIYDKKSIWNVYQEQTFHFKDAIKGINTFGVELHSQKIHMKGFEFKKYNPAYELNRALDCDEIYGDTFEETDTKVKGIGNNVSLVFKEFDFGTNGISRIHIKGSTPLNRNTIHIRFKDDKDNTSNQIVEFEGDYEGEEQTFKLDNVTGVNTITFLFLPGCEFDFESFRFE